MSGHELRTWLLTQASGEVAFPAEPDLNLPSLGEAVVEVLNKRRADVQDSDLEVMHEVVQVARGELADPRPEEEAWRHRLMTIGHDPLKPDSPRPDEDVLPGEPS